MFQFEQKKISESTSDRGLKDAVIRHGGLFFFSDSLGQYGQKYPSHSRSFQLNVVSWSHVIHGTGRMIKKLGLQRLYKPYVTVGRCVCHWVKFARCQQSGKRHKLEKKKKGMTRKNEK